MPEGNVEACLRGQRDTHRSLDAHWRGTVRLLVRLQGRFAPSIKGRMGHLSSTMVWDPEAGERVDPWPEERRSFDAQEVLRELGLSLEQIEELHRALALRASWEDPLSRWHPLARMAPFTQREKLGDAALRAQDGYDAADMVRRFYHLLTSELLPEADEFTEPRGGGWRRQLLGEDWPTLRLRHKHLVAHLRRLGLWPLQVHLIVEGDSEEVAAREVFEEFLGEDDLGASGISITNLRGIGNLQHQKAVFSLAKAAVSWTLLICDQEGDAARDARQLQAAGLLDPETTVLWEKNFEEDNFTDEEIVDELRAMGSEKGVPLAFDATTSRAVYEERKTRQGGRAGGFADFLVKEAANPQVGPLSVTKPQLARRLAAKMLDDLDQLGREEAAEKRPFLAHMLGVLRVA